KTVVGRRRNKPMTTRPKQRDPLGCLADVLVEDILETPGGELLAESAQDRREARALSAQLDERIKRLLRKLEPQGGVAGSAEEERSQDANGTSNAEFDEDGQVGRSGLPRRWRSAHKPTAHVRGRRVEPFIRRNHAGTLEWPVGRGHGHL